MRLNLLDIPKSSRAIVPLLVAALLMTLLLGGLHLSVLRHTVDAQIQAEGRRLVRIAARLAQTEQREALEDWAHTLLALDDTATFVSFALADLGGAPLIQATRGARPIPAYSPPATPSAWYRERKVDTPANGAFFEFSAPVLNSSGDLESLVVVGFSPPTVSWKSLARDAAPLFALSLLVAAGLYAVITRLRPGLSPQLLARLQAVVEGKTSDEHELMKGIPGYAGPEAEQLRALLLAYWQKVKALEKEVFDQQITHKVSLYTKARFESIFEEFPDGVMLLDESAVVSYVNSKIEIFLGKPKAEVLGHKFHHWSQDEAITNFFASFQTVQSRLRRKKEMLFSPSYLPGRALAIGAYPVETGEHKTFLGTLILCRDMTAEALAKQARGDFVAHVSHELKSPLNVLKMYCELLMGEDGDDEETRKDAANVISDEVERLSLMIGNLLSISKIEMGSLSLERQRVKVLDLLADVFKTMTRSGKETDLTFKLELPHELSPLALDKDLFRVALNNLLTNAIKYNRPQGEVTLSAEETDNQITIQVRDTGLGISEQDQGHIYEKFFRVNSDEVQQRPGHGLGLALAKNIIEMHHGRLKLDSTLGEGSTFSIIFDKGAGLVQEGL